MPLQNWENVVAARYDWAWAVRRQYLLELGFNAKDVGVTMPRPVVALYGRSQVGKTGLILRLLGLADSSLQRANAVLRGGQLPGQPATVTAQVYRRNEEPVWTIRAADALEERHSDDQSFAARLKVLRQAVHDGSFRSTDKVHIGLPSDLFGPRAAEELPVIVDLPGVSSAEVREQAHVRRLMEAFLTQASAVVVVTSASNLSGLGRIDLAGDTGWHRSSGKFIIVLTFAVSGSSVSRHIGGDQPSGFRHHDDLRAFYRRHLSESAGISSEIHVGCVEFGESWSRLDERLRVEAGPWLEEEIRDLRGRVRDAVNPRSGLQDFSFDRRRLKEQFEQDRRTDELELAELDERDAELRVGVGEAEERVNSLDEQLQEQHKKLGHLQVPEAWPESTDVTLRPERAQSVKALQQALEVASGRLRETLLGEVDILRDRDPFEDRRLQLKFDSLGREVSTSVENARATANRPLNKYRTDWYRYSIYLIDKKTCADVLRSHAACVRRSMRVHAQEFFESGREYVKVEVARLDRLRGDAQRSVRSKRVRLNECAVQRTRLDEAMRVAESEYRSQIEELRKASDFSRKMEGAFRDQLAKLAAHRVRAGAPVLERHAALIGHALAITVKSTLDAI